MAKPLVIVESPAKAKTIAGFLGGEFTVESSIGHIRDLPRNAADVPPAYKGESWARLGVDVDNDFKPLYVVSREKKDQVRKLKALLKDASELYLATDEDREGESIAWHLLEVLAPQVPVKRMVFHEITRPAIERAVRESRDLDRRLVDAQETRRILDRLYGYEVSPVLWKKVMPALSAGRVQSVATRLLVERERARMRFVTGAYWDLTGTFEAVGKGDEVAFEATTVGLDGRRLVTGKDFDASGQVSRTDVVRLDEPAARALVGRLDGAAFSVRSVEEKPWRRSPAPPFMTSTLQQEAGRKLRFPSARTMRVAQDLYESGFITYMRTDSTTLSDQALNAARAQAGELYGSQYVPAQPRRYEKKVKNAQEAHEAIRPAGESFRTPAQTNLSGDARRLYELIWMRTVASQMADSAGQSVQVRLGAVAAAGTAVGALGAGTADVEFATSGRTITFPGFLRAYVEGSDDPDADLGDRDVRLPVLAVGDALGVEGMEAAGHETQPPARYTEASLVKALEEMGVGRPSTYASIMGTIQDRGYVWKKGSALIPSWTSFAVVGLLEQHFARLVDYNFTASMEEDLDEIARGSEESVPWLTRFYFGHEPVPPPAGTPGPAGAAPAAVALLDRPAEGPAPAPFSGSDPESLAGLKRMVSENLGDIDAREINSIVIGADPDGHPVVVRVGRYGPYVQRDEDRASIPEDLTPDELTVPKALELLEAGSTDREVGPHPDSGLPVLVRAGRYGPYVQVGEADQVEGKPQTASLLRDMDPATLSMDEALKVLSLPRLVGTDPATGEEIVATNGRYGPYIKKGTDSRSLGSEDELFSIDLSAAQAIFAQPKTRRGQTSTAPLKELGPDPVSGGAILLKEGRFGPYVTDGETNASLRKGDAVESLTAERAHELLADRRAAGPAKKRGAKKAPAGRAPAKKVAKKATTATKAAGPAKKATATRKVGGVKKAAAAKKAGGVEKATAATRVAPKKAAG
jgi:DNA topoisomerase-1